MSIVKLYKGGKQFNFERFSQKTVKGIIKQYKMLYGSSPLADLYFRDYENADRIVIETPNGDKEYTSEEFMEEVSS